MRIRERYTCPLEIAHDGIRGKWKAIILFQLRDGAQSLSQLERRIEGIGQKMLLQQLDELQEFGLVRKRSFEGYPLHVEYSLTPGRGRKMLLAVGVLQEIGIDYMVEHGAPGRQSPPGINSMLVSPRDPRWSLTGSL